MGRIKITPELLKQLEEDGYLKERVPKTFMCRAVTLASFREAVEKQGVTLQDAIDEAMRDWATKRLKK